jgi:hypothetical protein
LVFKLHGIVIIGIGCSLLVNCWYALLTTLLLRSQAIAITISQNSISI